MNNFSYMRSGALLVLAGFVGACASSQDAMISDSETELAFEQPEFSVDEETLNVINDVIKLNQIALTEDCAWEDAGNMIVDAQDALDAGDGVTALSTADEAKRVVEDELINCIGEVPDLMGMAMAEGEGEAMMDADAVAAEVEYGDIISYSVGSNDSLWSIAGRDDIYGDPYMWPLIYKLNSDKIEDPDLIYPEQVFLIEANPLEFEVDSAILHAQKRGEWSLEDLEFTDAEYLRL